MSVTTEWDTHITHRQPNASTRVALLPNGMWGIIMTVTRNGKEKEIPLLFNDPFPTKYEAADHILFAPEMYGLYDKRGEE